MANTKWLIGALQVARSVRKRRGGLLISQSHILPTIPHAALTLASIVGVDILALASAIGLTIIVRHAFGGHYSILEYARIWPVIGIFLFAFALAGLYPGVPTNPVSELRRISLSVVVTFLVFAVFIFLSRTAEEWSRIVFLAACLFCAMAVSLARAALRHILGTKSWWGIPAVILGGGFTGRLVAETLTAHPWLGLKVIGVLDESEQSLHSWTSELRYTTGTLDLADAFTRNSTVTYGIVAMPHISNRRLIDILETYGSGFRHLLIIPDLFGMSSLWVTARDIGGILGLEIHQSLLQSWSQFVKRAIDLIMSITGGVLVSPLLLVIACVIKVTSAGPVFYGQTRVGRDGKIFRVWKFRTMVKDADDVLNQYLAKHPHLHAEWKSNHKLRSDPRITGMGRILRRTSLDELPQLWNVLRGEMSLVGPRPIVDAEIEKYGACYQLYCRVRPGITGLWQVSGRSDTGYERRVQLDEYYVRNWSVWLDIYLLGRTFSTIFRCAGAY